MFPELVYLGSCDWLDYLPPRARTIGERLELAEDDAESEWLLFADPEGVELYILKPTAMTTADGTELEGELYKKWHGRAPSETLELEGLPEWDPQLLGRGARIGYTFRTPGVDGSELRWHPFGDDDGDLPDLWELNDRGYVLIGGAFVVTERGIVG